MSIMNADFAANILSSMVKEAKEPTKTPKPNAPSDPLKNIVVPSNLVESIVQFDAKKKGIELKVESKVEEVKEVLSESEEVIEESEEVETNINESKVQDIVTRLAALLSEAKEVLQEIGTTTGMLGVKETGPVKKANKAKKGEWENTFGVKTKDWNKQAQRNSNKKQDSPEKLASDNKKARLVKSNKDNLMSNLKGYKTKPKLP